MIYVVYRIYSDEPNKGYYLGKWKDPIALAKACYNMYPLEFDNIKIVAYEDNTCIEDIIEW